MEEKAGEQRAYQINGESLRTPQQLPPAGKRHSGKGRAGEGRNGDTRRRGWCARRVKVDAAGELQDKRATQLVTILPCGGDGCSLVGTPRGEQATLVS